MTKRITALSLLFLFLLAFQGRAQDTKIRDDIDRYLTARSDMGAFSGAVLVAVDGRVIIRKGYGFADVEKRVPYTAETQHEVASISKMFTSMAVLKLRERGKIKLDDPICKYVDNCPDTWKPIVIEQLMHHTSGIPDYEEPLELGSAKYLEFMARPTASAEIIENAKKLPLDFTPGEKFSYSNTAYNLLSLIVQKVAGESFDDFVRENVLEPAGMKHSVVMNAKHLPKGLAKGYSYGDLGWEKTLAGVPLTDGHLKQVPVLPFTSPEGDAFLITTLDDLYVWSRLMDGSKFIPKPLADEILTPNKFGYGYGWFVGKAFDRKRVRHTGGLPGYISDLIKFPDDKITIILFSNVDRARLSSYTRDICAIALGKSFDMPVRGKVVKLTEAQLLNLEGKYNMSDGELLTVKNDPDFLTAGIPNRYTAGLIPLSPTEFYFPLGDGRAIFKVDEDGKPVEINMRYNGEDHIGKREK